jgi:hypothetical protein
MKVSEVLTRRALRYLTSRKQESQGNYLARLITETLSYLDELESRGAIPRPMPRPDDGPTATAVRGPVVERGSAGPAKSPPFLSTVHAALRESLISAGVNVPYVELSNAAYYACERLEDEGVGLAPARLSRASIYSELRESLNVSAVPSDVLTQVVEDFFERFCMPDDVIAEGRRLYSARNMPGGREDFEAWLLEHGRALFGMPGEDERGEEP